MRNKIIIALIFFIFMLGFSAVSFAGTPSNIPEGFCQFSWGTPPNKVPAMDFIDYVGNSAQSMYQIKNVAHVDASSVTGNILPKKAWVFFYSKKQLFQGRLEFDREDGEKIRRMLVEKFGIPEITIYKFSTRYIWKNDLSVLEMNVSQDKITIDIIEPHYYRSQP